MTTTHEREARIDAIRRLPEQVEYLAGILSPEEHAGRFLPGEWSAAQNVHHLADSHMNAYVRCRLILTEEEPQLKPYDQERWAELPDAAADVAPSIAILHGLHARWTRFWQALAPADWGRLGMHEENGPMTLDAILRSYAAHGEAHLTQIRRTVAAQYTAPPATHEELLTRIDREWLRLNDLVRRMTPAQLEAPYAGGWSPREHLAHVTAWERYLIGTVIGGQPPAVSFGLDPALLTAELDIDAENDLLLAASASKSLGQVFEEFHAVHTEARAAVAGIRFADWVGRTRAGDDRPLLDWIAGNSYDHYLEHWQWLPIV
jgi:hypothetical protein